MDSSIAGARGPRLVSHQREPAATSRDPSTHVATTIAHAHANMAHAITVADSSSVATIPAVIPVREQRSEPSASDRSTGSAANWGLGLVYAMLAYEWLLSGLNKSLSGTFRNGLANRINGSLYDNPHGWYVSFIKRVVLPHTTVFAAATLIGELLVAAGLLWGAMLWLRPGWFPDRFRFWLGIGVTGALAGAAVMELNYYLLAGEEWPWLKTHDPFNVGLSVDGLVLLISLVLIPVQLAAVRASFGKASPSLDANDKGTPSCT